MTQYNLNVTATVKLNKVGIKALEDSFEAIGLPRETAQRHLKGNVYRAPLWDIMNIFGPWMAMTKKSPFINNEIRIEE